MGLSWQQGPLSSGAIGRFLIPEPLNKRLLYAEPLRRRMRVRFGGVWIADSEEVILLFEPGKYPMSALPMPFCGKEFPTYFRIAKEPKNGLIKTCPLNRTIRVDFD